MWFRRDLRLHDNPALLAAADGETFAALFVFDERLLAGSRASPNRNWFLRESLRELRASVRALGGELFVRHGRAESVVPEFVAAVGAGDVYASRDYTPFARRRDRAVAERLEALGSRLHLRRGTLALEPEQVLKPSGEPYSVFTPFRKRWDSQAPTPPLSAPSWLPASSAIEPGEFAEGTEYSAAGTSLPLPGESAALGRLGRWCEDGLAAYQANRDLLAADATSRLSQDLRLGLLSPAQVIAAVRAADPAADTFVSELAWRDFYAHILWHHPRVRAEPFQRKYGAIAWREDPASLEAWKDGRTGYPVVDAAMRQLRDTGYMHNRARMVTASFLAKHLLIDWRLGEAHFMRHLVDGDPASNGGGWQWAASTGTDAQPYFRIFNPVLQGQKFDPHADYVRRWCPELAHVSARHIHAPWQMSAAEQSEADCRIGRDYPAPIVDHAEARQRALDAYGAARQD